MIFLRLQCTSNHGTTHLSEYFMVRYPRKVYSAEVPKSDINTMN